MHQLIRESCDIFQNQAIKDLCSSEHFRPTKNSISGPAVNFVLRFNPQLSFTVGTRLSQSEVPEV